MTTTLITGANKGLGLETTRRLIEAGHFVYAGMRDISKGANAAHFGAHVVQLDVMDQESVDSAFSGIPALDVLINNAGIIGSVSGVDEFSAEDLATVLDTNVLSIVRVTNAALPLLRRSSNPVIVNVASGLGFPRFVTDPSRVESSISGLGYPTSKSAVIMLTLQYSKLLPTMRVNSVDPGYTGTDLNGNRGRQTVTEGTDAVVTMAKTDSDGPTGTFSDREGLIAY